MFSCINEAEIKLARKMKQIRTAPVGWWVIIYQPRGAGTEHLTENTKQLITAVSLIEGTLGETGHVELYICTNAAFVLLGKGTKSKKLDELEGQLFKLFQTTSGDDIPPEEKLSFETKFYDLSAQLTDFIRHFAVIIAESEKIKTDRLDEQGVLRQNFFPALEQTKKQALVEMRLQRKQLSIMFIEDDRATLSLLRQLMNMINSTHSVTTAETAEKGVSLYFDEAPDVLFLDVNLPDASGLEILEFICTNDQQSHVVMLTAEASVDVVKKALGLGAKGFVRKPFTKKQFQSSLENFKKKPI